MDTISTIYAEVKPPKFTYNWPRRSEEEKQRMRDAMQDFQPGTGKPPQVVIDLSKEIGARIRDAGIPRHVLAEMTSPATGKPLVHQIAGWDERDAALKFWKKAYCA
jgi:hypothetical protein